MNNIVELNTNEVCAVNGGVVVGGGYISGFISGVIVKTVLDKGYSFLSAGLVTATCALVSQAVIFAPPTSVHIIWPSLDKAGKYYAAGVLLGFAADKIIGRK